ncbi:hypothetical protein ACOME3_002047 [Neoechinorhynchus agilis]
MCENQGLKAFLDLLELHRQTTHTLSDLKTENLTLDYEVGLLRDEAFERSEELYENERQRKEMQKEIGALERAKREAEELSQRAKSVIEHRDELIKQAGLFLYVDPSKGQEDASRAHTVIPECMLSQSTLQMISEVDGETIEDKMRNLIDQNEQLRKKLCEKVRPMRRLDESPKPPLPQPEEHKPKKNLSARSVGRVESVETKLKIERLETELNNLKEENNWLQIQSRRTKERIEQAEQSEDQALQEKRKLQKELRETKDLLKQATDSNVILQARLDKLRELRRAGGAMSPNKTGLE